MCSRVGSRLEYHAGGQGAMKRSSWFGWWELALVVVVLAWVAVCFALYVGWF